ncbi:MAG: signal peptidase II [Xanthomonadaceae bacterium]|nr:signal peptidase II [Xanthomonadaceae bacterium]
MKLKYKILAWTLPLIIVLDQITKMLIVDKFTLHEMLPVINNYFDITRIHNTGAAFGMLANADPIIRIPFFIIIPIVALGMIFYFLKTLPDTSKWSALALALILSGAIGNLIDRIVYGYVVDFLYFSWNHEYFFPAFNVADSAISIGASMLALAMFENKKDASTTL